MEQHAKLLFTILLFLSTVGVALADTGGTITTNATHTIHSFTADGTYTPTFTHNVTVLVVAGGGAGGGTFVQLNNYAGGGGGGGGGVRYNTSYQVNSGSGVTVVVGAGGALNDTPLYYNAGYNGSDSAFGTYRSAGGGGGASYYCIVKQGGSGGGTGSPCSAQLGISGQGNNGGEGAYNTAKYPASGGGGCGAAGSSPPNANTGGAGGTGCIYGINGSLVNYGGGGNGTHWGSGTGPVGLNNTGWGGNGGGGNIARVGGYGVVIVSYLTSDIPVVATNTCTPPVGSTWTINITDNCNITYAVKMNGSNIIINGNVTTANSRLYISPQGSIKNFTSVTWNGLYTNVWGLLG
jgi:hypothetical protein